MALSGVETFFEEVGVAAGNGAIDQAQRTLPAQKAADNMFVSIWKKYKLFVIGGAIGAVVLFGLIVQFIISNNNKNSYRRR